MDSYAIYLRKSRFDRDYQELSTEETLKRHEAILTKLAQTNDYHITKVYHEVVSGESIAARPEVQKLLEEVANGIYTGVLVVDLERLARGNGADQAYISQVFQFSGTKIITPQKVYDPTNEFDEEYFEFGLFMSRREYKTINRRLIRGRDSSAAEGKYISSIAPYGYRRKKIDGEKGYTLEIEPSEAKYIKIIFDMFLHHSGAKVIANYLNDCGVPTRHGGLWTYSTISNIITNPVYMGKIRRGWSRQIKSIENGQVKRHIKRKKNMDDYQTYNGLHPSLVSEEDFLRVQEIRRQKAPAVKEKETADLQNAFVGLLYCSNCGMRIGRTLSSAARGSTPRLRCVNARNCHNVSADYEVVEHEVISALRTWLNGYRVKIDTVGYQADIAVLEGKIQHQEQELSRLNAQLERAFELVEQGVYTKEIFCARQQKLTSSIDKIKAAIDSARLEVSRMQKADSAKASLIPQTEQLLDSYEIMTTQERNLLLREILQRIEYRKDKSRRIEIDLYPRLPKI